MKLIINLLLVVGFFTSTAQSIIKVTGNAGYACINEEVTFEYVRPGGSTNCAAFWNISGSDYTIVYQSPTNVLPIILRVILKSEQRYNIMTNSDCGIASYSLDVYNTGASTVTLTGPSTINAGQPATFSAQGSSSGTSSGTYNFSINSGTDNQSGTSNTYTTSVLKTGDKVRVVFYPSNPCVSSSVAERIVQVQGVPEPPSIPQISANPCGPKILTFASRPSDVTWYWQGTTHNGTSIEIPLSSTYTVNTSDYYYIRARNNNSLQWSSETGVRVTVSLNPPAPSAANLSFCEFDNMVLTTTGANDLKWYNTSGAFLFQGLNYPADLLLGTTTFRVKAYASGCESLDFALVKVTVNYCDNYVNSSQSIGYGVNSNGGSIEVASSKSYLNGSGQLLQSQSKNYTANQILASQPIYNQNGIPVINTLAAPINKSTFGYRHKFISNSAKQKYNANDFDKRIPPNTPGGVFNPNPVANGGTGTLGWYYSSSNTLEPFTPVTNFPYTRSYSPEGPDPVISISAGPGDQFRMGSTHEGKSERQLIAAGELSHYISLGPHFVSSSLTIAGYKHISTDPDGKKAVSFVDSGGKTLATATLNGTKYENWSYAYYNDMGKLIATVAPNGVNTDATTYPNFVTLYKYDHRGRLIEVTSPDEGTSRFVYSTDGEIRFSQNQEQFNANPKRFSYTNYDYLGRLVEAGEYTVTGTNPFVFETHTVSPNNYATNSILKIIDKVIPPGYTIDNINSTVYPSISQKLDNVRCRDYSFFVYDNTADLPGGDVLHAAQANLYGEVARTENANTKTWYSYDESGQLLWTKQQISDLGIYKTIDYTYDNLGNITDVAYQKGVTGESFYHHYTYDADQRLIQVSTSKDGITQTLHATYKYYLHGPLKRAEIASSSCKQGIDYLYTINGALKSINHGDPGKDPGKDGIAGSPNASFVKDFFGETLHYNDNDYTGAAYNPGSVTLSTTYPNQFGGNLRAVTYNNTTELNIGGTSGNAKHIYAYQYDAVNQLINAQWGNITNAVSPYKPAFVEDHKESIPTIGSIPGYDKNGNIQALIRKGKSQPPDVVTPPTIANYTYVYQPGTNRLDKIKHNGTQLVDYTYNALGQMIQQNEGATRNIKVSYNPYGLVKEVKDANNGDKLLLSYVYDDRGDLIKKISYNASGTWSKYTYYIQDALGNSLAIYEQTNTGTGKLQLTEVPIYGAGRVAVYKPQSSSFLYEFNDHLGNVRAVCEMLETTVSTFYASMETERISSEEPTFKNIANTKVGFSTADYTHIANPSLVDTPNESASLNKDNPAGPTISLAVSPGDKIDIDAWAYYEGGDGYSEEIDPAILVGLLANAFGGVSGAMGDPGKIYSDVQSSFVGAFEAGREEDLVPHAYILYVLYDKNYNKITSGWKAITSDSNMAHEHVVSPTIEIEQPGFIYICLYNASNTISPVYFDEFRVAQTQAPIVAGSDYYPFGLVMDGTDITDKPYRYGYQGQFSEKDITTGWNEFELRMYDARFGRWLSPDPYGQFASPYLAMGNNPVMNVDPDGGLAGPGPVWNAALQAYVLPEFVAIGKAIIPIGTVLANGGVFMGKFNEHAQTISSPKSPQVSNAPQSNPSPPIPDASIRKPDTSSLTSLFTSEPGVVEGLIPVWGNTREAAHAFANGSYGMGALYSSLAVADVVFIEVGGTAAVSASVKALVPVIGRWGKLIMQSHHVIPQAVIRDLGLEAITGFSKHGLRNIKRLPFPFHGSHYQYNKYVTNQIEQLGKNVNLKTLTNLQNHLKREIRNAYRLHKQGSVRNLNEYFRTLN